ncbi:unnamed protein product [Penicillium egyptiacum]|uniref:Zn(2)-C6 fungal-type domain-containing protein n=1 Tax=Penicillium egyptiacum TaxID=1303716 RepID=A0A9W4NZ32_9EURO|nr:unnamed protein product [Penicillium egyptiacum]
MDPMENQRIGRPTRSSLACLPCRSRHRKCDGKRPCCSRCAEGSQECKYARSRRGGLDRAARTEQHTRWASAECTAPIKSTSAPRLMESQQLQGFTPRMVEVHTHNTHTLLAGVVIGDETFTTGSSADLVSMENDPLIDSYYRNFHPLHPFLLPRMALTRLCQDPCKQPTFRPLIAIMRFVGNIMRSQEWSIPLKDHAEACFTKAPPTDPILVQCRLLYSIPLFWYEHKIDAKWQMETAMRLAIDLRMSDDEFLVKHGDNDSVVQECWRRTWWMLFTVDAYYAGTLGTMNFEVLNIGTTVALPCDESDYELGVSMVKSCLSRTIPIPEPKTLQDFDCREFTSDDIIFSSFAYLIGAVRCIALAISTVPKIAGNEGSTNVIQAADSILNGWLLLLPENRKQVMDKAGEIDELMFQAQLLIHVATIVLHRPLSDLKFYSVEEVSSCARNPSLDTPAPDLINVHTVRVLRAVEAQVRLIALPTAKFHHTPFVTCMISKGTLALLSACKSCLGGKDLMIARDQIRMTVGCLKALGKVWPRTARNVREIQTIASHILGLESSAGSDCQRNEPSEVPGPSGGEGQGIWEADAEAISAGIDIPPSLSSIEDLCGWFSVGVPDSNSLEFTAYL